MGGGAAGGNTLALPTWLQAMGLSSPVAPRGLGGFWGQGNLAGHQQVNCVGCLQFQGTDRGVYGMDVEV